MTKIHNAENTSAEQARAVSILMAEVKVRPLDQWSNAELVRALDQGRAIKTSQILNDISAEFSRRLRIQLIQLRLRQITLRRIMTSLDIPDVFSALVLDLTVTMIVVDLEKKEDKKPPVNR